jgi:gluconolactonase
MTALQTKAEDFSLLRVERIATGFPGAEGPVWSRDGYLLFSDFENKNIHRYDPAKGVTLFRSGSQGANGNTMDRKGRLYTCEYVSRRVTRTSKSGKIEVLAEAFEGRRFNAPNDIIVRRDGQIYFTDPLFTPLDKRDLDFYGVYHMTPTGKLEVIAKPKGRPCWAASKKTSEPSARGVDPAKTKQMGRPAGSSVMRARM